MRSPANVIVPEGATGGGAGSGLAGPDDAELPNLSPHAATGFGVGGVCFLGGERIEALNHALETLAGRVRRVVGDEVVVIGEKSPSMDAPFELCCDRDKRVAEVCEAPRGARMIGRSLSVIAVRK